MSNPMLEINTRVPQFKVFAGWNSALQTFFLVVYDAKSLASSEGEPEIAFFGDKMHQFPFMVDLAHVLYEFAIPTGSQRDGLLMLKPQADMAQTRDWIMNQAAFGPPPFADAFNESFLDHSL